MKSLFALAAFALVSLNAQAAIPTTVLEVIKMPGFEMNPERRDFAVLDNGDIIVNVKSMRDRQEYSIQLGHLEENAVRELQQKIRNIPADAKLVDAQEGKPLCMDAPSYEAAVWVKGKRKVIAVHANCHEKSVDSYYAQGLMEFGMLFLHTAK